MVLLREPGRSRLPLRRGCRVLESVVLMVAASLIVLHASLAPQAFVQPQPVSIGSQPKSQLMKGWSSNGLETSPLPERGAPSYVLGIAGFSLLLVYGTLRQKTSRGAQPRVVMAAVPLRVHLDRSVARTVMAEEMVHGPTSPAAKEATSVCAKVSLMHTPTAFCEDVPSLAQEKVTAPKTAIHAVLTTAPQNGNKASPRTARFVGGSRRAATQGQRRSQSSKKDNTPCLQREINTGAGSGAPGCLLRCVKTSPKDPNRPKCEIKRELAAHARISYSVRQQGHVHQHRFPSSRKRSRRTHLINRKYSSYSLTAAGSLSRLPAQRHGVSHTQVHLWLELAAASCQW